MNNILKSKKDLDRLHYIDQNYYELYDKYVNVLPFLNENVILYIAILKYFIKYYLCGN